MAKCHICNNEVPGARQGTRYCEACKAQHAIDILVARSADRAALLYTNGTLDRMQRLGDLLITGQSMSEAARRLNISRTRLYDFVDTYNLTDYVHVCQAMGKTSNLDVSKEMDITRRELLASAIKCAIEGDMNGYRKPDEQDEGVGP